MGGCEERPQARAFFHLFFPVLPSTHPSREQVSAIFSLSPKAASSRLPVSSPFPIDPIWRQKQLAGFVLDRLVGSVWSLLVLLGFNKDARYVSAYFLSDRSGGTDALTLAESEPSTFFSLSLLCPTDGPTCSATETIRDMSYCYSSPTSSERGTRIYTRERRK